MELSRFDPLVLVDAVTAKVIGYVKVEVSVLVVVFPRSCKGKAGVVLIEASLFGDVLERPVAVVSPEDVFASVVSVVKWNGLGEGSGPC